MELYSLFATNLGHRPTAESKEPNFDPNWFEDLNCKPIDKETVSPLFRYLERSIYAYTLASSDEISGVERGFFLAFSLQSSASLIEALLKGAKADSKLVRKINGLPYRKLVEDMRNFDVHGAPIPVAVPGLTISIQISDPKKPMRLHTAEGAGVCVQYLNAHPTVTTPMDGLRGKVTMGHTVSYLVANNVLFVDDGSKQVAVIEVMQKFLLAAQKLVFSVASERGYSFEPPGNEK